MTKRPNSVGRIEADPKPKKSLPWKALGKAILVFTLVLAGIAGTLGYQQFVDGIKAQGVSEYKAGECQNYSNEDKSATWLECEPKRVENGV